jgi:hypothetical protein
VNASTRALWLAVILIVGLIVGVAAGVITWISNRSPYAGILAGGGGFAGTVFLLLAMAAFLAAGA